MNTIKINSLDSKFGQIMNQAHGCCDGSSDNACFWFTKDTDTGDLVFDFKGSTDGLVSLSYSAVDHESGIYSNGIKISEFTGSFTIPYAEISTRLNENAACWTIRVKATYENGSSDEKMVRFRYGNFSGIGYAQDCEPDAETCDQCELALTDSTGTTIEPELDRTYIIDPEDIITVSFSDCDGVVEQIVSGTIATDDDKTPRPVTPENGVIVIPTDVVDSGTYTITAQSENCDASVTITIPCTTSATITGYKSPRVINFDASGATSGNLIRIGGSNDGTTWTYGIIAGVSGTPYDGLINFDDLTADIITSGTYIRVEVSCDGGVTWSEDVRRIATSNITETLPNEVGVDPLVYTLENLTPDTENPLFTGTCYQVTVAVGSDTYSIPVFDATAAPDLTGIPASITWNGTGIEYVGVDDFEIILRATNKYSDGVELGDNEGAQDDWVAP